MRNRAILLALLIVSSTLTVGFLFYPEAKATDKIVTASPNTIWVPDNYTKIQAAINAANPGDTIFVSSGTYYENVVVNKTVSLTGENRSTTIIDGNGTRIVVHVTENNVNISDFTVQNSGVSQLLPMDAGIYIGSTGSRLYNNVIKNNNFGVLLHSSGNNVLRNNSMTGNNYNFGVDGTTLSHFTNDVDTSNTVDGKPIYYWVNQHDKQVPADAGYVALVNSENITLSNLNLTRNGEGVLLAYVSNCTVKNVGISHTRRGIHLYISDHNTISENTITNNRNYGVYMFYSSHNSVTGNFITNNGKGVFLIYDSLYNFIGDNVIVNTSYGIEITGSATNNIVNGNVVTSSKNAGIKVKVNRQNTIKMNKVFNNFYGIYIEACWNTLVENEIADNEYGIYLYGYIDSNIIKDNALTNNTNGIRLTFQANRNTIRNNTIMSSINAGISLEIAPANTIIENSLTNNGYGIHIQTSNDNNIRHNNFINNTIQVYSYDSINIWDDGYPSGGNYWSDYTGVDLYSGPYQNETGSDGMGDTPYVINENNQDNYPLMNPWGSLFQFSHPETISIYQVHLEVNTYFSRGYYLITEFYSYNDIYQGNVTVWCGTTPSDVVLSMNITHPHGEGIEKVYLVLRDINMNKIQTITSFTMHRSDLISRDGWLDLAWIFGWLPKPQIFLEIIDIDMQWPYAPP